MLWLSLILAPMLVASEPPKPGAKKIGSELAIPAHLADGDEHRLPLRELLDFGKKLFMANWTEQDGGGRPLMKGNGKELSDRSSPLVGSRSFNLKRAVVVASLRAKRL